MLNDELCAFRDHWFGLDSQEKWIEVPPFSVSIKVRFYPPQQYFVLEKTLVSMEQQKDSSSDKMTLFLPSLYYFILAVPEAW